ncbi:MAG: T9SS type A sorting domain-containing protein [Saprospiraceae bacterium]|nr:T9SS type A sorting domain-containing protein [Saprospiraceae bacterium]
MKAFYFSAICLFAGLSLSAQSTAIRVYEILQEKCVSCHGNAAPEAGLDLEGSGANISAKMADVYNNLVGQVPANEMAAAKGDQYIYKGRMDRSFLFRKINNGLDDYLPALEEGEGQPMPAYGASAQLTDFEKELIRQWILYGAPTTGTVVDEDLLTDYYIQGGNEAFPDGVPEAPAPEEGFQIKMGPFFLQPGGEVEYFTKYQLDLPEDQEVVRLDIQMSNYSHHFIMYDFPNGNPGFIPDGLRLEADHTDISLVAAVQEPTDLRLPQGTAFPWNYDRTLDLNSHYINYSATQPYKAEAYVNVYTQEAGTAAQEMKTALIANTDIYIPNSGNEITHSQQLTFNLGEIFLWGMMGHTHQWGTDYKVYHRLLGGQKGDLLYDASCALGIPGCVSPYFDYQHIPMRYFEPLEPITMNFFNGLIHEAKWVNNGNQPVWFGPTSNDEMMVLVMMYTEDTTGIITQLEELPDLQSAIRVAPNPMEVQSQVSWPEQLQAVRYELFDAAGRLRRASHLPKGSTSFELEKGALESGLFFLRVFTENGSLHTVKLLVR